MKLRALCTDGFIPAAFKTGVIAMDWKARFGFHNRNGKF
jgi:hypothetical protein